jgi:transposase
MEMLVDRCSGLDVHKKTVVACVRVPGPDGDRRQQVRTFKTFTAGLEEMADWLVAEGVTTVAMESTGVYWWPVWHVLEERGCFELLLVNARHAHNVPGRKTDVADAAWLAQLAEYGLLRGSFVPEPVFRRLRDLTRYRRRLVETHTRESHRIAKVLEDAGIKLDSVASKVLTVSGRRMIAALCDGERDPEVLADMAMRRMRAKIPELQEALVGRFDEHHALMCRLHLDRIGDLEEAIKTLDSHIEELTEPMAHHRRRLCTIPGVADRTAEVILAEIGTDMGRFPTAGHLASWAGMCPGHKESAGKNYSGRTRPGNPWLRAALTQAAWSAARTRDKTYLGARFWRIARRRGKNRAAVAVGHSILVAAFHIVRDGVDYHDLGGDWFIRHNDAECRRRWLVGQLERLDEAAVPATVTD